MKHEYSRWTFVEITKFRKLRGEGKSPEQIAHLLGMPVSRVTQRVRQEDQTPEQKRAKVERAKARRQETKLTNPRRFVSHPHQPVLSCSRPSPEMIEEAQRRADAPRSLTAEFFGDPGVGYSMLDRR